MTFFISSKAILDVDFEVEANSKAEAMDKFRSGFFDYWDISADVKPEICGDQAIVAGNENGTYPLRLTFSLYDEV